MKIRLQLLACLTALLTALAQPASAALTNRYVIKNNAGAMPPYDSWANAAANIQAAIDYAYVGETVLVAAATYDSGGVTNHPGGTTLTNRIAIYKKITVRSASNNPGDTIIKGAWDPVATNGPAAVRCAYLTNDACLAGFTLTNGATLSTNESLAAYNLRRGGACANSAGIISNCVIAGNCACYMGSGVNLYNGKVYASIITGNRAFGGGTQSQGGGISGCALYYCTVSFNSAAYGGGAMNCTLYSTLLAGNSTYGGGYGGGGAFNTLYNCTIAGNSASGNGGGEYRSTLYNCISWDNNKADDFTSSGAAYFSCGVGGSYTVNNCTTSNPSFADAGGGNYRLRVNSPCFNSGSNQAWMATHPDLDGRARIRYGTVDMGAYEGIYDGTLWTVR